MTRRACPTPWKQGHASAFGAHRHLRSLLRSGRAARPALLHQYLCPCGLWHVGHTGTRERTTS